MVTCCWLQEARKCWGKKKKKDRQTLFTIKNWLYPLSITRSDENIICFTLTYNSGFYYDYITQCSGHIMAWCLGLKATCKIWTKTKKTLKKIDWLHHLIFRIMLFSSAVVSTVTTKQEGPGFETTLLCSLHVLPTPEWVLCWNSSFFTIQRHTR